MEDRLQKIIARAGLASRRAAEEMIQNGEVTVNGKMVMLGDKADPEKDEIRVRGRLLPKQEALEYYIVNKPRGVLSTVARQPEQPDVPIIIELVESPVRLYPVGRLDLNSEGLVLLTNDGDLTNQITHPSYGHKKTYKVKLGGGVSEEKLNRWRSGVTLSDGFKTTPCSVKLLERNRDFTWIRIIMGEGHKRQIREIAELLGIEVLRLIRTHIGPLELGDLPPGKWRKLTPSEVNHLKETLQKQQQTRVKQRERRKSS